MAVLEVARSSLLLIWQHAVHTLGKRTAVSFLIASTLVSAYALTRKSKSKNGKESRLPPMVSYWVPFFGSMVSFGMNPIAFLAAQKKKHGEVFTFVMFGRKMTYLMGNDGNYFFFNAKGSEVSAEEAYASLTVPVFGEGVVYDVPNSVLMEQKKMIKSGLNLENLKSYVPLIEAETREYFKRWGKEGKADLFTALSELTIMTASRCLMGKEIRNQLDETVAGIYHDLDKGFTPLNFLFPWLPLPSYYRRDAAHVRMRKLFLRIMEQRRKTCDWDNNDMLQSLMMSNYKDGRPLTDKEVAHLMIALLMAGQHTSSTTGTWLGLYLAQHHEYQSRLLSEQAQVCGNLNKPLDYDTIKEFTLMDKCIKETLRLRPPIITIIRKVIKDQEYKGFTIPAGHFICTAPGNTHLDPEVYEQAEEFIPERVYRGDAKSLDTDDNATNETQELERFWYVPFGAGRHRCIGEPFAYLQIKTIMSTILRMFDIKLDPQIGMPERDWTSLIVMPKAPVNVVYKARQEVF